MLATVMAALMSSLSSAFNSASTIFTVDVWKICRPKASERELLIVGRAIVCLLVVIGFVWIPVVSSKSNPSFDFHNLSAPLLCANVMVTYGQSGTETQVLLEQFTQHV